MSSVRLPSAAEGVSERDALIVKLWNAGVARQTIRNRLACGSAAIDRALASHAAQGRWVAPRRGPREGRWMPERIAQARRMWLAGETASVIGRALELSRGAVINKLARLGVTRGEAAAPDALEARTGPAERARAAEPVLRLPPPHRSRRAGPEEPPATVDLMGLGRRMCRWPIGEPDEAGFGFCGRPAEKSYCEAHRRRAYCPEPLEPIEAVAGLKPQRPAGREPPRPAVFDGWARR